MRILHVANFSWFHAKNKRVDYMVRYYAPDRKINNGLVRHGHVVWDFSFRDTARYCSPMKMGKKLGVKRMNEELIRYAAAFKPDLLLLGHSELVTADTIEQIKKMFPNCKVGQWWVDWFTDFSVSHIVQKLPLLDAFFSTTGADYARQKLEPETKTPIYYMPNMVDAGIEVGQSFAQKSHDFDLLFLGANAPERATLLKQLKESQSLRFGAFGFDGSNLLTGGEFMETFPRSKAGLNLSRATDIPLYASARIAQTIGNGCLTVTPTTPQMDILFSDDEVFYYDSQENLADNIAEFLKDDQKWRKVAENGWKRAHASYNEKRVTQFMLEALFQKPFSEAYEWAAN